MLWNTIWLALRSIRRNLLRSFLTILGIVIGVSAVITMVTLGNVAAPTTLLAVFGFFVIVALEYRKVTGAIIIGTLLDELERQDKNVGLATLCIASGMGAATIIERV